MLDAACFPDEPARSCAFCLGSGFGGFTILHSAMPRIARALPHVKCGGLYVAALANVAAWRGVWMSWDLATGMSVKAPEAPQSPAEREEELAARRRLFASGLVSHLSGAALLIGMRHLTSTLAPPARIGVLSDRQSWAKGYPSKYLEDVGMFIDNRPIGK